MIVAVTMRLTEAAQYYEKRDAVSHDLIEYLDRRGHVPVLVPNALKNPGAYLKNIGAQGLLLSGGDNIEPCNNLAQSLRDKSEHYLLRAAINNNLPVLGICRGLQLINFFFGGNITQDLKEKTGEDHVGCNHMVSVIGRQQIIEVNSYHKQGVIKSDLATSLRAIAISDGGVIEALEHETKDVRAVMWHPERSKTPTDFDKEFIDAWLT
jgi:gamma-glutamyl-gamma-aminobutyrate hydrolase PuuD